MKRLLLFSLGWLALISMAGAAESQRPVESLRAATERFSPLAQAESPSFRRHVIPLLSRVGCSGRECHGSFSGQGGFQLSLFGYDFEKDHTEITADADGGEGEIRVT